MLLDYIAAVNSALHPNNIIDIGKVVSAHPDEWRYELRKLSSISPPPAEYYQYIGPVEVEGKTGSKSNSTPSKALVMCYFYYQRTVLGMYPTKIPIQIAKLLFNGCTDLVSFWSKRGEQEIELPQAITDLTSSVLKIASAASGPESSTNQLTSVYSQIQEFGFAKKVNATQLCNRITQMLDGPERLEILYTKGAEGFNRRAQYLVKSVHPNTLDTFRSLGQIVLVLDDGSLVRFQSLTDFWKAVFSGEIEFRQSLFSTREKPQQD